MDDFTGTRIAGGAFKRVAAGTVTDIRREADAEVITIECRNSGALLSLSCFAGGAGYGEIAKGDKIEATYTSHAGGDNPVGSIRVKAFAIDL